MTGNRHGYDAPGSEQFCQGDLDGDTDGCAVVELIDSRGLLIPIELLCVVMLANRYVKR